MGIGIWFLKIILSLPILGTKDAFPALLSTGTKKQNIFTERYLRWVVDDGAIIMVYQGYLILRLIR